MFYVAYFKSANGPALERRQGARATDAVGDTTRPVTFLYNGGPGSSTVWLHMGAFGPASCRHHGSFADPGGALCAGEQ